MKITYSFYRFITSLIFIPLSVFIQFFRFLHGDKNSLFLQRFGLYNFVQPEKASKRIWIHASSVGETGAACAIIDEIKKKYPDISIVFSTVTKTGHEIAERLTDKKIIKILAPLDFVYAVSRAFDFLRPDTLVLTETELWPNMIMIAAKKGINIITANGRISESTRSAYKIMQPLSSEILSSIIAFSMISEPDSIRIADVGADPSKISVNGNSKYDQAIKLKNSNSEKTKAGNLDLLINKKNRQLIVAGSTRPGEEEIVIKAFLNLKKTFPDSILAIAPRHIKRTSEIEKILQESSISYSLRTALKLDNPPESSVIILDTIGELAALYRLADAVFCGGSLFPFGGQNPMEAAVIGKPILFGPFMDDFADVARILIESGSAKEVKNAEDLFLWLAKILGNQEFSDEMGKQAAIAIEEKAGAAKKHAEVILKYS
ncbi:3-deoxy-D-manno-octulosonic acid transferase [Desulforegula conservatrix]|uniref:3-deoxy-D-manno-octulosonic acid transferase n=1 Tax=Desulforegula conservatrix TaxID=153026 RepID=UPI0018DBC3CC|nr:glycosyltransferase N-terminal domain-containing protein [Desulforegula conservatrix]